MSFDKSNEYYTMPSGSHQENGQEEEREQCSSQPRNWDLSIPRRHGILISNAVPNHKDEDLLEDFFWKSPSPSSASHIHGIANHT
ncbi:uncharacterized protein BT62DRAFT_1013248 [Guyanagaster necrorhizus]|uniref:Uncharacterized protein n=1 Tax=Guyanagaster necrorhizus TaxID=856835 RepID=A0A9P7VG40_9AGAR|nr:uncharacterized protein BT62DRAFT_1013248 [Guyanagaster necrorhizus MCA 3950]KAG7439915.1 hypothetical protein BT62DRAFT_1013248 [Guyanagaster necrorhizus MCA 3950]